MAFPFRSFRLHWHRLLNTKVIELDGVAISTDTASIPRNIRSMLFKNVYEKHERDLAKKYLKKNDQVLEIGTGIGFVSLVVNKICGENNVVSYEANPDMETTIRQNFALNKIEPNLNMRAVTRDGSDIVFYKNDGVLSSSSIDRGLKSTKCIVKSDAINKILTKLKPTWIVMDVEGAEIDLLSDNKLVGVKGMIVELHPHIVGQEKIDTLIEQLSSVGFDISENSYKTYVFTRHL